MQIQKRGINNSTVLYSMEYIKHPLKVGTIFQSSIFLAKKVAKEVVGKNIVELGPGTGKVTKEILNRLSNDGKLICIESNPKYCNYLQKRFAKDILYKRLYIIHDSAERFSDYIKYPDCVVSGLPLKNLHKFLVHRVLSESKNSKRYIQYQYYPFSKKRLLKYFKNIKVKRQLLNPIPATIYVCSN